MQIKKLLSTIILLTLPAAVFVLPLSPAQASEADIMREIRSIREELKFMREDMNKRFEQVDNRFEQVDKRFEQVDKRFEQVDKRFEQFMWFFGLWVPLSMGVVGSLIQRINRHDDRFFELSRKQVDAEDIIYAIEKADAATKKRLKTILKN